MYQTPRPAEIAYRDSGGRLGCRVAKLSFYVNAPNTLPIGRQRQWKARASLRSHFRPADLDLVCRHIAPVIMNVR
jgi:hypothetical protein